MTNNKKENGGCTWGSVQWLSKPGRWVHSTRALERAHLNGLQQSLMLETPFPAVWSQNVCGEKSVSLSARKVILWIPAVFLNLKNQICHNPSFLLVVVMMTHSPPPSTFHPGIALLASVCFSPSINSVFTVGDEHYIFQPLTCSICRCKKLWKMELYLYGFNSTLLLLLCRKATPFCCKTKFDLVRLKCSVKLMEPGVFQFLSCVSVYSFTNPLL